MDEHWSGGNAPPGLRADVERLHLPLGAGCVLNVVDAHLLRDVAKPGLRADDGRLQYLFAQVAC